MRKKGSIFILMLTFLFVAALLPALYLAVHSKSSKFERDIGEKQAILLKTYEKGEVPLYYIDEKARSQYMLSVHNVFLEGLIGCEEYDGYPLLNTETESCFPDIKKLVKKDFGDNFNLEGFPEDIPEIGYDTYLTKDGFIGKAKKIIRTDIGMDEYNFAAEELIYVATQPEIISDETEEPPDTTTPETPTIPIDDGNPESEVPIPEMIEGKCGYLVDYADTFIGCPYLLNCGYESYIACQYFTPGTCSTYGLTCATFVGSVITQKTGFSNFPGHGATKCSSNSDKVTMLGTDPGILQPGDVFQAGTNIGHTGMYVGRGYGEGEISYFGVRTCYENFNPDPNGKYVFIHSIGNSDGGPPGVCYEYYEDLFAPGRNQVTMFCRLHLCE